VLVGFAAGTVVAAMAGSALIVYVPYATVGAILVVRRPRNAIGWLVAGVLGAVFAGLVVGLQALLASVTQGQTLAVAASTLVAFALFQPIRRRVQSAVDRRFDRARYDGERTMELFAERIRNEVDLATLKAEVQATAERSLRPLLVGLWFRADGRTGP